MAGVLQGDTLAPYQFLICLDYVLWMSIGFTLEKASGRWYPAETIMDTYYADDRVVLVDTSTQDESLLHSLERAAEGNGLDVNAEKKNRVHVF